VQQGDTAGFWPWLSVVLVLGWLATALLWWRQRHSREPQPESQLSPAEPGKPNEELPELKRACRHNDAAACKSALLKLAKNRWPEQPPASLGALATRVDSAFAETIDTLNRALYGQDTIDWDGAQLLREAERWLKSDPLRTATQTSPIPPLHPQRG
jgi:hypothetical protein